jgi:hypothetical protein
MTQVTEHMNGGCSSATILASTLVNGGDLTTIPNVADAAACGTACCGNSACNGYTYNSENKNCHLKSGTITTAPGSSNFSGATVNRTPSGTLIPGTAGRTLDIVNKEIDDLKKFGLTETSDNEAMKKLVAERNALQGAGVERPGSSTPPAASPPTTPTPGAAAPPKPVMSCNIENFASY